MNPSQHTRTSSYIPPSSTPLSAAIPRKRNLSASAAVPVRPPPNLRTASSPSTPQPVKEEEDEDDGKDDYGDIGVNTGETPRDEETKKERERILLEAFTPEQMQRYEVFRRANLNKGGVKKLSNQILSQSIPQNIAIVIAGFAKVFVGEIVESAREVQLLRGDDGPLAPEHLREAWRLYKERGSRNGGVPESGKLKRLFK